MLIRNLKIYKKDLQKLGPTKFIKKYAAETVIIGAIALSVVGGASSIMANAINKEKSIENQEVIANYMDNKLHDNVEPRFYVNFVNTEKEKDKIIGYIEVSERLHHLGLDVYDDIETFDYIVPFLDGKDLDNLIQDYENLKAQERFNNIGDDVIELNKRVYELKSIEKQYNEKLSASYDTLIAYGLNSSKLYLSDLYGSKPSDYKIDIIDQFHDGPINIEANGIRINDEEVREYLEILRNVYNARDTNKSSIKLDEYNADRNKVLKNSLDEYDKLSLKIIKKIDKEKENETRNIKL